MGLPVMDKEYVYGLDTDLLTSLEPSKYERPAPEQCWPLHTWAGSKVFGRGAH